MPTSSPVMPLGRQLGDLLDAPPIPVIETISGPTRPSRGRWPKEVWDQMQAIYAAGDAFAEDGK